jgi:hypothetical protein
MRLRSMIVLLIILVLIGSAVYIGFRKREWWMPYFTKARQMAEGYTPAKTPDEARDKFRTAVKDRDYESAAVYCTADYADQLRRGAEAATALGKAIDNLEGQMEVEGVKSDKVRIVLRYLEPFPKEIKLSNLEKKGDDKAVVTLEEDFGGLQPVNFRSEEWKVDLSVFRALAGGPEGNLALGQRVPITLIREGQGDAAAWKLDIPVKPEDRTRVDTLKDKYKNYVKALEKLQVEVRTDAVTKTDLERRLRTELEEAK